MKVQLLIHAAQIRPKAERTAFQLVTLGSSVALAAGVLAFIPAGLPESLPFSPPTAAAQTAPGADIWTPPTSVNRTPSGAVTTQDWGTTAPGERSANGDSQRTAQANVDTAIPAPGLGIQSFYGLEEYPLDDSAAAAVNFANGNVIVRDNDLKIAGPGIGVALDRFYNGLSNRTGAFGRGWSISAGHDVGLDIEQSNITFRAPSGFRATFVPAGAGFTPPAGFDADLARVSDGFTVTYRRTGEVLSFTPGGFLTKDADRNGNSLTYLYNGDNTLSSVTDVVGRVTTFTYVAGLVTQIADPAGRVTNYAYTNGVLSSVRTAAGGTTTYSYDANGQLSKISTATKSVITFTYDSTGRATAVKRFLTRNSDTGTAASTTYQFASGLTTITTPNGGIAKYSIDTLGRVTQTVDPLGRTRTQTWTSNSTIATAVDAMGVGTTPGNVVSYSYDSANNPTAVAAPTGATARAAFLNGGACGQMSGGTQYQIKCSSDAQGNNYSYGYDAQGNVAGVRNMSPGSANESTAYTYQRPRAASTGVTCGGYPGQVCSITNGLGATTGYTYGANGVVATIVNPAPLGSNAFVYDSISRVTSATDGKGQITRYSYDLQDRVTRTTYPDSTTIIKTFNLDGNLVGENDSAVGAGMTTYTFDALNRQVSVKPPNSQIPLTVTLDLAGNTTSAVTQDGTIRYYYDLANQLISLRYLSSSTDTSNCLRSSDQTNVNGCISFTYDANGNRTIVKFPGDGKLRQRYAYDAAGRINRIWATSDANATLPTIMDYRYSYTAAGQTGPTADRSLLQSRTAVTAEAGSPAGLVTNYAYDTFARLISAVEVTSTGAANASWAYSFDKNGNRLSQTLSGNTSGVPNASAVTTSFGYNLADQLISTNGVTAGYSYDSNGNQTSSPGLRSSFTVRDQVSSMTSVPTSFSQTYSYTGATNSRLLVSDSSSSAENLVYENSMVGVSSRTQIGGGKLRFIRTPSGELLTITQSGDPDLDADLNYLKDHQNSVVGLADADGKRTTSYSYDPYGVARSYVGPAYDLNPYRYISGQYDGTLKVYKLGVRYYDPAQGRFTQLDPTGQSQGYSYAAGNPVNQADPSGAFPTAEAIEAAASAAFQALGFAVPGGLLVKLGVAVVQAGLDTLVSCLLGCEEGVLYTALVNGLTSLLGALSFGLIDDLLETVGERSLNAAAEYLAGQAVQVLT